MATKIKTVSVEVEACACDCDACWECEEYVPASEAKVPQESAEPADDSPTDDLHLGAVAQWNALNNPGHAAIDPPAVSTRFNETAVRYIQKHLVLDDSERAALIAKVAQW